MPSAAKTSQPYLLVSTQQHDLLVDAGVQLVQRLNDVTEIDCRSTVLKRLVEYVVAKQLEQIAIAGLAPASIALVLGPLVDKTELRHQTKQTTVVELETKLALEHVVRVARAIGLAQPLPRQQRHNIVNRRHLLLWRQQIENKVLELGAKRCAKLLDRLGRRKCRRRALTREHDDQLAQSNEVVVLVTRHVLAAVIEQHVDDGRRAANAQSIAARHENFRRVQRTTRQTGAVNRLQRRHQLRNVRPDLRLGEHAYRSAA